MTEITNLLNNELLQKIQHQIQATISSILEIHKISNIYLDEYRIKLAVQALSVLPVLAYNLQEIKNEIEDIFEKK